MDDPLTGFVWALVSALVMISLFYVSFKKVPLAQPRDERLQLPDAQWSRPDALALVVLLLSR